MPVTERLEDPGSFELRLDASKIPFDELRQIDELGHIVITPQWFQHPELFAESDLLEAARYSGVILEIDNEVDDDDNEQIVIRGAGNVWHLGTDITAPILAEDRTFTADALTDVLAPVTSGGILPPAIKVGTITTTGVGTFPPSGTVTFYESQSCIECVRTVMDTMGMTFRIKPNWEIDACLATRDEVFVTTTPTVVAVRKGFGADPSYTGIEPSNVRSRIDATRWVSRSVAEETDTAGARSIGTFVNRDFIPYQDPHGNELVRNRVESGPVSDDVGFDTFHASQLATWDTAKEQEIDTSQWEFSGAFKAGDWIWAYDPARGLIDPDNQIFFRGQVIAPVKMRATVDHWPITDEMGVYARPGSTRYRQAVLADGPIAYWRLDETTGTTAADEMGVHDGTYVGSPSLNQTGVMRDGSNSPSVEFNGSTHRVTGQDWETLDLTGGEFTIEAWFDADNVGSTSTNIIVQKRVDGTGAQNGWELGVGNGVVFFLDNSASNIVNTAVSNGVRYHVVIRYDGTSTQLWLNGVLAATGSASSVTANTEIVSIGQDAANGGFWFDGHLDEIAIYGTSLSQSRIRLHYLIGTQGAQAGRWIDLTRYLIPDAA